MNWEAAEITWDPSAVTLSFTLICEGRGSGELDGSIITQALISLVPSSKRVSWLE
jgi:hypothetical protein